MLCGGGRSLVRLSPAFFPPVRCFDFAFAKARPPQPITPSSPTAVSIVSIGVRRYALISCCRKRVLAPLRLGVKREPSSNDPSLLEGKKRHSKVRNPSSPEPVTIAGPPPTAIGLIGISRDISGLLIAPAKLYPFGNIS